MTRIEKIKKALKMGLHVTDIQGDTVIGFYGEETYRYSSSYDVAFNKILDRKSTRISNIPIDQWEPDPEEPKWTEAEIREAIPPGFGADDFLQDLIENLHSKS